MNIFRNAVLVAAIAGVLTSLVMTALQAYTTVPLILQAETFENAGEPAHDHGAVPADAAAPATAAPATPAVEAHEHDPEAWAPADGFERFAYNALANIVTGIGFALVLVAVSELGGGINSWRQGALWGLAGFAVFTLAPNLGLPPELPAMPAAEIVPRQIWWISTVAATAAGLALIVFRGTALFSLIGVALIVAPHVVGAPQPVSYETAVPEGLHHQFVVAVTVTNLVFWVLLGGVIGMARQRFSGLTTDARTSLA
jgi:cobalt transporter subunit CbtA